VGLGDGIDEGLEDGVADVGSSLGAGVGMLDGNKLGEGEGIEEGLVEGRGVVGGGVGDVVGKFIRLHVVHVSVKSSEEFCPNWKTVQFIFISGGVLLQLLPSTTNTAIAPESPEITQLSACTRSYPQ